MNAGAAVQMSSGTERVAFTRSGVDRREGEERRLVHDIGYFENGGVERRFARERRLTGERRSGWVRVSQWGSIYIGEDFNVPLALVPQ